MAITPLGNCEANAPYQLGFSATHQEGEFNALPIQGKIPRWLRGSLIRTGPGTLEVGKQSYHRQGCFSVGEEI